MKRAAGPALLACALLGACEEPSGPLPPPAASTQSSALLRCPTPDESSALVTLGPTGGIFEHAGHRVAVPEGALKAIHTFVVRVPAGELMEVQVREAVVGSFLFESPISITIDYSRCSGYGPPGRLGVWHIDEVTKQPLEWLGGTDNRAQKKVTFQTHHLSGFAIAE